MKPIYDTVIVAAVLLAGSIASAQQPTLLPRPLVPPPAVHREVTKSWHVKIPFVFEWNKTVKTTR